MLKLFHIHYRIVDPSFGIAKCTNEGDTTLVIDTDSEGDFDTAISDERARIAKEYELEDDGLDSLKVVFTNFSLLHSEEAIALSVETVPVVKCFEGDRVVASVKSNQPKFL